METMISYQVTISHFMHSLLQQITAAPDSSVGSWPFDPALRRIPEGCPRDLSEVCEEIYEFHLHEVLQPDGTLRTSRGSFHFNPDFQWTVADGVLVDASEFADPSLQWLRHCHTLGYFGMGNEQLILDLNRPGDPKLRFFFFYPVESVEDYPEIGMSFTDFVRACINAGPDRRFVSGLVNPD